MVIFHSYVSLPDGIMYSQVHPFRRESEDEPLDFGLHGFRQTQVTSSLPKGNNGMIIHCSIAWLSHGKLA